jgi:hypothetical protein
LQMIYKCSNHSTHKDCVDFTIGLLLLSSELPLRFALRYSEHVHGSKPQHGLHLSSLEMHASKRCWPQCIKKYSDKTKMTKIRFLDC